ncbi:MAG: outer membrane lipoprotein-sorting protein [Desulfovibrio sp.]
MRKINTLSVVVAVLVVTSLMVSGAFAVSSEGHHAPVANTEDVVRRANHMALYQGDTCKGKVHLKITDSQGRTRLRDLNILRKDLGESDGKQLYMSYFRAPADVRKMVFLVHKTVESGKDDSRWLYMPSLDMVKRIAAGDKRTSFAGSDFLYEDISGRGLNEDHHELLSNDNGQYVIRNTPKNTQEVEFAYYDAYINRDNYIPVKMKYYKKSGELYRTMEVLEIKAITAEKDGETLSYPTVVTSKVTNLETGSETVMSFSDVQYNVSVKDSVFGERYLRRPPRVLMR